MSLSSQIPFFTARNRNHVPEEISTEELYPTQLWYKRTRRELNLNDKLSRSELADTCGNSNGRPRLYTIRETLEEDEEQK